MAGLSLLPAPFAKLPWRAIFLVVGIAFFGLVVLYSAAGGSFDPWAFKQGTRFLVFLAMALALSRIPEQFVKHYAYAIYGAVLIGLILVELLGAVGGGSRRWISLGPLTLQPSELMKVAIVLTCAKFYDGLPAGFVRSFNAIWPPLVAIGVPAALVMLQPDLGTSLMIIGGALL